MKQNTTSARLAAELRDRIQRGELRPGEAVPSARQLVREHGVALATASRVLAQLRREGLVRVERGIGTIVRGERGPDLSIERIVQAAIAIADDEGTVALTMRSVARELGVATMSLYRHVSGKEALLLKMADAVLAETPLPPADPDWRRFLTALARTQWDGYARHRWLAPMLSMTRPQPLPNGMRHTEAVLATLVGLGFDDATALRMGVALMGYVRGMAVGLEAEREAEADTGMDQDAWMRAQGQALAQLLARFPTLDRVSRVELDMGLGALFETGLACFLDGIAAAVPG